LSTLRWDSQELQKKLKKLGVAPPPPSGQKPKADILKPGKFYSAGKAFADWAAYVAQLRAAIDGLGSAWSLDAYGHNVMIAALAAAPVAEWLARPHGHVAARPVLDNRGYLVLALLAAEHVRPLVPAASKARFQALVALAEGVVEGRALSADDEDLIDRELPMVRLRSRAQSRELTAEEPAVRVAQAAAMEAEETDIRNVGGKGARAACALAAGLVRSPRAFLAALDARIALEDARTQLEKVKHVPSAQVEEVLWRGAENGKSSHWLVRLASGRYALLWKAKGKWRLDEGGRDDMLATVSDSHAAAAMRAVLAGRGK
jgi:hypothetical protein